MVHREYVGVGLKRPESSGDFERQKHSFDLVLDVSYAFLDNLLTRNPLSVSLSDCLNSFHDLRNKNKIMISSL